MPVGMSYAIAMYASFHQLPMSMLFEQAIFLSCQNCGHCRSCQTTRIRLDCTIELYFAYRGAHTSNSWTPCLQTNRLQLALVMVDVRL
jgi:hypothetical protein